MESRRLQRVGSRSFSVTLPKEWVTANRLKEHDLVFMERTKNDELLLKTGERRTDPVAAISVSVKEICLLREFIVLCYVKNVKRLTLNGELDYERIAEVKHILRYLEGYEITSQDERSIEISFLFGDVEITVPVILRRMTYLLKLMLQALDQGDMKSLEEFETSLDRLYHLSKRIFAGCIGDQAMRSSNGVDSMEQLFFLRGITKRLENIGDRIYSLRDQELTPETKAAFAELLSFVEEVLAPKRPLAALRAELAAMKGRLRSVGNHALDSAHELCQDVLENQISILYDREHFA